MRVEQLHALHPRRHGGIARLVLNEFCSLNGDEQDQFQDAPVQLLAEKTVQSVLHIALDNIRNDPYGIIVTDTPNCIDRLPRIRYCLVDPPFRYSEHQHGIGIGTMLVNATLDYCRSAGYEKICLNAKESVVGFYEKLGFVRFNDTLRFEKELN